MYFCGMLPQWQTGIVRRIEEATANTHRYWVELTDVEKFEFKPGQFVTLDLPIHEQRNKRWRSYSIASMPDDSNIIELIVVHLETGVGSKYIYEHFKVGSTLTLRGPQGVFVLPPLDKELFLICTGTGIAPFRSMMHYVRHHNIEHQPIHIIFGTRTQDDLLYADEMKQLVNDVPRFHYHPVLSREQWQGHTGYVHQVYEQLCVTRQSATFMLCGWRPMIDEAKQRLLSMGYTSKDIHIEIYG